LKLDVKELLQVVVVVLMNIIAGVMKTAESGTLAWIGNCIRPALIKKENIS